MFISISLKNKSYKVIKLTYLEDPNSFFARDGVHITPTLTVNLYDIFFDVVHHRMNIQLLRSISRLLLARFRRRLS